VKSVKNLFPSTTPLTNKSIHLPIKKRTRAWKERGFSLTTLTTLTRGVACEIAPAGWARVS